MEDDTRGAEESLASRRRRRRRSLNHTRQLQLKILSGSSEHGSSDLCFSSRKNTHLHHYILYQEKVFVDVQRAAKLALCLQPQIKTTFGWSFLRKAKPSITHSEAGRRASATGRGEVAAPFVTSKSASSPKTLLGRETRDRRCRKHSANRRHRWGKKASNAGSHLEIVAIPPDVSLQLSGSVFSPEPSPPPFIYHPSVRREPQLVGCAPARLCLVNSTSDIHQTAEGCHSTEIDSPFVSFFVIFFFCVCFSPPSLFSLLSHPFPNNKAPLYQKKIKKNPAVGAPWCRSYI